MLTTAIAASQQENWSLLTQCLQQLPLEKEGEKLPPLAESTWVQIRELALQVLQAGDFQQKWDVAKIFPKLGKPAIASLIEILEDEAADVETRWFAGRILSQFDDPACVFALANLLQETEEEELSAMASQALANIGISAVAALRELLADCDSRLLAVQALSQIRRSDVVEPLLAVVNDPSPEIRATAIEALSSFHDERILAVLLQGLQDLSVPVRKEAAIALGLQLSAYESSPQEQLRHQFVEQLKPLLYDFSLDVCLQTAIALARMGTDEAAEALFPVLKSPATPLVLKLQLVRSLGWIDTVQALHYLQAALRWGDRDVCREIVMVLGRKEPPELKRRASEILLDFLASRQKAASHLPIKQAVVISLGELGEAEGIPILQQLADDPDQTVRLHAIAALKKFPELM